MQHELPPLPYATSALAPHMSRETLEFHHGKHHKAYVTKLNELQQGTEFASMPLEDIVRKASGTLYNNAAQAWNHAFFWNCLQPRGGSEPSGELADAIRSRYGDYAAFRKAFKEQAVANFGSGWTWLVGKRGGGVEIVDMDAAGTPLTTGDVPLLTLDVWEHAYYIDYRNERPKFVDAFFEALVNWRFAGDNFRAVSG